MIDDDDKPLEARVADLEARAGTRRKKTESVEDIPLIELNRRSQEIARERRAEKKDALGVAKTALEKAFENKPFRAGRRVQKPVTAVAAEMTAQVAKVTNKAAK